MYSFKYPCFSQVLDTYEKTTSLTIKSGGFLYDCTADLTYTINDNIVHDASLKCEGPWTKHSYW